MILANISKQAQIASNQTINVVSGEAHLFEIEANNPFSKSQKFFVNIEDEDFKLGMIKDAELVLVDNSAGEWEHWYSRGKCTKPNDWKLIKGDSAKKDKREMHLDPGMSVKLLFKFQSFREPVYDFGVEKKENYDPTSEMKPR